MHNIVDFKPLATSTIVIGRGIRVGFRRFVKTEKIIPDETSLFPLPIAIVEGVRGL